MAAKPELSRVPIVAMIGMATLDHLYVLDDYPQADSVTRAREHVIAPEKYVLQETGHSAEQAVVELWGDSCRVAFGVTQGRRGGVFTTGKEPGVGSDGLPLRSPPSNPVEPATPFTVLTPGHWRRVCPPPSASLPPPGLRG